VFVAEDDEFAAGAI